MTSPQETPLGEMDLGHDHWLGWLSWAPDDLPANRVRFGFPLPHIERVGCVVRHRTRDGSECLSAIHFNIAAFIEHNPQEAGRVWEVVKWEPLTRLAEPAVYGLWGSRLHPRRKVGARMSSQETPSDVQALVARLRERYTAEPVPPCRVCGRRLTIQRIGGGMPIRWGCSGQVPDPDNPDGTVLVYLPGRTIADDHYGQSIFTQVRTGDSDVLALCEAVERMAAR